MDDKPYKFDSANPRFVTNIERSNNVYYATAALFVYSVRAYQRRIFRLDNNVLNFALFTAGSAWASYEYANFALSSPIIEAGIKNNELETQRH